MNEVNEKNESISKLSYLEKNVSFYPNIPTGNIYQDILDVNFILAPTAVIKTEAIKNTASDFLLKMYDNFSTFEVLIFKR